MQNLKLIVINLIYRHLHLLIQPFIPHQLDYFIPQSYLSSSTWTILLQSQLKQSFPYNPFFGLLKLRKESYRSELPKLQLFQITQINYCQQNQSFTLIKLTYYHLSSSKTIVYSSNTARSFHSNSIPIFINPYCLNSFNCFKSNQPAHQIMPINPI